MNLKGLKVFTLALVCALSIESAQAGVLIEPMIGYQFGSADEAVTGGSAEHSYSDAFFGARLGYQQLGLMAGLDYRISSFVDERDYSGSKQKNDVKESKFGFFVGYNLPILLRAWVGYYFSVSQEDDDARGGNLGDERNGSGPGIGLGFTGLPFISINLEYHSFALDEYKNVSAGTTTNGSDYDVKEFLLSVSLPLDF